MIRYDYRDTGQSTRYNLATAKYTALDLAQDTHAVLQKYNLNKAAYVGFSMGCQVGMVAAAHYPQHISHLIMFGDFLILSLALRLLKAPPFLKACQPPRLNMWHLYIICPTPHSLLQEKGSSVCQTLTQSGWSTQGI
ncbi:MAG: alpha/beta hydrolase [Holosporaceae bacterium]|nr:MAG: alpha/beta hydrolase [Holosporaceae bacterium]